MRNIQILPFGALILEILRYYHISQVPISKHFTTEMDQVFQNQHEEDMNKSTMKSISRPLLPLPQTQGPF